MSEIQWREVAEQSFMEGFNNAIKLGARCERIKLIHKLREIIDAEPNDGILSVIDLLESRNI
jgi:hypothetical protein